MFRAKNPLADKDNEMMKSRATTPAVNPAMVERLNMASRHGADRQDEFAEQEKSERENRKLTVGPGIQLKGEITNCDTLVVEGHVEASTKARTVKIAKTGTFIGDIEIDTAEVSGHFDGSLKAKERLMIRSTGRVSGKIRYNAIEIEAGGQISGAVQATSDESPPLGGQRNKGNGSVSERLKASQPPPIPENLDRR